MKHTRRLLSALLAAVMLVTSSGFTTLAEGITEGASNSTGLTISEENQGEGES